MTPSPCACGGAVAYTYDLVTNLQWQYCCEFCGAQTPECADQAAARAWNAMQAAVQEGVEEMVPLRWKGEALYANKICLGQLWKNQAENWIWGGLHSARLHPADTREQAEAALLAHVMGE